jgi:hypothetical protein
MTPVLAGANGSAEYAQVDPTLDKAILPGREWFERLSTGPSSDRCSGSSRSDDDQRPARLGDSRPVAGYELLALRVESMAKANRPTAD